MLGPVNINDGIRNGKHGALVVDGLARVGAAVFSLRKHIVQLDS